MKKTMKKSAINFFRGTSWMNKLNILRLHFNSFFKFLLYCFPGCSTILFASEIRQLMENRYFEFLPPVYISYPEHTEKILWRQHCLCCLDLKCVLYGECVQLSGTRGSESREFGYRYNTQFCTRFCYQYASLFNTKIRWL